MLHVLIGEDDFSIRQALDKIKETIGDATALMSNTNVLDGREVTPEQLRSACDTVPFLAEERLVIVEGLLQRFESGGRNGRRKSAKSNGKQDDYTPFADCARQVPDFTELVLVDGKINNSNPLLRGLSKTKTVKTFPLLNPQSLKAWIGRRVAEAGGSIAPGAVDVLVRFVSNDLWKMANEVDKLVLYTGGRRIEEADTRAVVSDTHEANIFAMADAIVEGRTGYAQDLYQQLLSDGDSPMHCLAMLLRQVRMVFLIREMRGQGVPRNEIKRKLGIVHDFQMNKAWAQADKYTPARLRDVYHRLLDADLSIKTGRCEPDLALNILITEMSVRRPVSP